MRPVKPRLLLVQNRFVVFIEHQVKILLSPPEDRLLLKPCQLIFQMVNRDSVVPSVIDIPAKRVSTALFFTKSVVLRNKNPAMIIPIPANK